MGFKRGFIIGSFTLYLIIPIYSLTSINKIQGFSTQSPFLNQVVATEGIVTADYQSSLKGFFIQNSDFNQDQNINTSEGLFVQNENVDVSVGDHIKVSGKVIEKNGLTQLSIITKFDVLNSGIPLPVSVEINLPFPDSIWLERFEGMRIHFPQKLIVIDNYNLGRFGQVDLATERQFHPNQLSNPGTDALKKMGDFSLARIILDDYHSEQNLDPIIFGIQGKVLSLNHSLRIGDNITGISGVLTQFLSKKKEISKSYLVYPDTTNFISINKRNSIPPNIKSEIKVASFNVMNFFNGDGNGTGLPTSRGAKNLFEFERQKIKIINSLKVIDADVYGLMEIENDGFDNNSAMEELVGELRAVTGRSYEIVVPNSSLGKDDISVGIIYDSSTLKIHGSTAVLDQSINFEFNSLKNRPALAQAFQSKKSSTIFTLVVNHFKSKGSSCEDVGDFDKMDGQSNCNETRTKAAKAEVEWLKGNVTGTGDSLVLIIGDLNAYAKEDPIRMFVDYGYTDLIKKWNAENAYTYVYKGLSGYLDHALANKPFLPFITSTKIWHINADEPKVFDYKTAFKSENQINSFYGPDPFRSSDHDPVIIGIDFDKKSKQPIKGIKIKLLELSSSLSMGKPALLKFEIRKKIKLGIKLQSLTGKTLYNLSKLYYDIGVHQIEVHVKEHQTGAILLSFLIQNENPIHELIYHW